MTTIAWFFLGVIVGVFGILFLAIIYDRHDKHDPPNQPPPDDYNSQDPFDDF